MTSRTKADRIGSYFMQRLGAGWESSKDESGRYSYGAVSARRGDVRVVLEANHVPVLRVSFKGERVDSGDDIIPLPVLPADKTGALAAGIAWAVSRAREWREA